MRTIKQACGIALLSLILIGSAHAGDMPGMIVDPPPPPDQTAQSATAVAPSSGADTGNQVATIDPLTAGLLSVVESVLSLF